MGIDGMRVGGGRCPPLLVGGLLVACLMLVCNWWTLSSENMELVRQIDELNEQLKISAEERDQCVTLRGNLEEKYKRKEDEVASLHVRLEQQNELSKKNQELEVSVTMCKSELDSLTKLDATKTATLETLRLEKATIDSQLSAKKTENKQLQEEVEKVKDELDKAKLACNSPPKRKSSPLLQPTGTAANKTQLGPVPDAVVRISVAGERGLMYHGIPILPTDPPGAVRQVPRFSVTMLKAQTATVDSNTLGGGTAQDLLETEGLQDPDDHAPDPGNQNTGGDMDDNAQESERDQLMNAATNDPDKLEDGNK